MTNPKISVVMSVYNGEDYIFDAVQSILNQTFKEFELIILNDGSIDNTSKILNGFNDERIKISSQDNRGLVYSLNRGVELAKADIIARNDADDISDPKRLETQFKYFNDKDIVLVGSSITVINEYGKKLHEHRVLINDPELKQELMVRSPFAHGSVMFRKYSFMKAGKYRQEYYPAEDYDLWVRLAMFGKFANIDQPLYQYRENPNGISLQNHEKQLEQTKQVQELAWETRRILTTGRIKLNDYKNLEHGQVRIERILNNVSSISRKSADQKNYTFAYRNAKMLAFDKLAVRKSAGKLKRKVLKK